jgi:hypothetical protein
MMKDLATWIAPKKENISIERSYYSRPFGACSSSGIYIWDTGRYTDPSPRYDHTGSTEESELPYRLLSVPYGTHERLYRRNKYFPVVSPEACSSLRGLLAPAQDHTNERPDSHQDKEDTDEIGPGDERSIDQPDSDKDQNDSYKNPSPSHPRKPSSGALRFRKRQEGGGDESTPSPINNPGAG